MSNVSHPDAEALKAGLPHVRQAPADEGRLELIVRRPDVDQREVLEEGELSLSEGLVGDSWIRRGADPEMQLNIMNARAAQLVAGSRERWPLAGDQLYLDLDLSLDNLPPGTRFSLGEAVIEVSAEPHTGCRKFVDRFGAPAMIFVNSAEGRRLNLRGINARVVQAGRVRIGDIARKRPAA